jgi:hypothetical protein
MKLCRPVVAALYWYGHRWARCLRFGSGKRRGFIRARWPANVNAFLPSEEGRAEYWPMVAIFRRCPVPRAIGG